MRIYEAKVKTQVYAFIQVEATDEEDFYRKVDLMASEGTIDYQFDEEPTVEILEYVKKSF